MEKIRSKTLMRRILILALALVIWLGITPIPGNAEWKVSVFSRSAKMLWDKQENVFYCDGTQEYTINGGFKDPSIFYGSRKPGIPITRPFG